jgi:hypothetical protein
MARDDVLEVVLAELRRYGIKPQVEPTTGGHYSVRWQLEGKPKRIVLVAGTPSDHRTRLNARAEVRRYLRADGASPGVSVSVTDKIFSTTRHIDPIPNQIADMRAEFEDLTTMLLEISNSIAFIQASLTPTTPTQSTRKIRIIDHVPRDRAVKTEEVAVAAGLSPATTYTKLYYLKMTHCVELRDHLWRRIDPE